MRPAGAAVARAVGAALACVLAASSHAAAGQGTLIVLNKAEATASLIDLGSGLVAATVSTGTGPHEVAVSPDGATAVATNYGTREAPGATLTIIDVPGGRATRTVALGEYRRPHGVAFLPDGAHVAVTAEENKALLIVKLDPGQVVASVPTDQDISHMVAVTPDGSRAFVANIGSGSVTAIDLRKRQRLANVPTGAGAEGIEITPDGRQVWVTNRKADTVTVLDAASLEILQQLESKAFPIRAKATPDGKQVLVSNANSADLAVFDASTRSVTRRIPMKLSAVDTEGRLFGSQFGSSPVPIGIVIPPGGALAYVANSNADVVSVVDLDKGETVGTLKAGREPDGLGHSPLSVRAAARPAAPPAPSRRGARPGIRSGRVAGAAALDARSRDEGDRRGR